MIFFLISLAFEIVGGLFMLVFWLLGGIIKMMLCLLEPLVFGGVYLMAGCASVIEGVMQEAGRSWKRTGPEWRWAIIGVLFLCLIVLAAFLFGGRKPLG